MKYISVIMLLFISCSLLQAGMEEIEEGSGIWEFTHLNSEHQEVVHEVNGEGKEVYDECNDQMAILNTVMYIRERVEKINAPQIAPLLGKSFVDKCIEEGKVDEIYEFVDMAAELYKKGKIDTIFTPEALFQFLVVRKELKGIPAVKKLFGKEMVGSCMQFDIVEQMYDLACLAVRKYNKKELKETMTEKEFFNLIRFELLALTSDKQDLRVRYCTEQTESE